MGYFIKLQTNPWHREEEPHYNHETLGRKQSKTTSYLFPIKVIAKLEWTQSKAQQNIINDSHNESNNQQWINKNWTTSLEQATAKATRSVCVRGGGLNTFYLYQIFALDSAVIDAQKMLSSYGGFLTIAMYRHRETI